MSDNPSAFSPGGDAKDRVAELDTGRFPVENVIWNDAATFCSRLSQREQLIPVYDIGAEEVTIKAANGYRLPTEAEWEFACRAGSTSKFWTGDDERVLEKAAWMGGGTRRTCAVGELEPNPFGLFDMHGNVYEWVQDWWEAKDYERFREAAAVDSTGPSEATGQRVARGGDWYYPPSDGRSSYRFAASPATPPTFSVGFRVALPVESVRLLQSLPNNAGPRITDFVEIHGATPQAVEAWAQALPQGFRPAWIAVRAASPEIVMDAVAILAQDTTAWQLVFLTDDTSSAYQEMSVVYRPTMSLSYPLTRAEDSETGNIRLWMKDYLGWSYWYGSRDYISDMILESRQAGFIPTFLSVHRRKDYDSYEVTFGRLTGVGYQSFLELGLEELTSKVAEFRSRGWRPHLINPHSRPDALRYLAVFRENVDGVKWDFSPSLATLEYEQQLVSRKAAGFYPQCVGSWVDQDETKFTVVWCAR